MDTPRSLFDNEIADLMEMAEKGYCCCKLLHRHIQVLNETIIRQQEQINQLKEDLNLPDLIVKRAAA